MRKILTTTTLILTILSTTVLEVLALMWVFGLKYAQDAQGIFVAIPFLGGVAILGLGAMLFLLVIKGDRLSEVMLFKEDGAAVTTTASAVKKCVRRGIKNVGGVSAKSIRLSEDKNGDVSMSVTVKLSGGDNASDALKAVKTSVEEALQNALGISIPDVDYLVSGLDLKSMRGCKDDIAGVDNTDSVDCKSKTYEAANDCKTVVSAPEICDSDIDSEINGFAEVIEELDGEIK